MRANEKMISTAEELLRAIARQMRITEGSRRLLYYRIKEALSGTPRLLIVDQIHNLCGACDDRALYVLADLHDATHAPQLWCGTTDVVAYLDRGQAKGREPLSQIRRRIGICRDLGNLQGQANALLDLGATRIVTGDTAAAVRDMDLRDTHARISAPTLVIVGLKDPATPPAAGEERRATAATGAWIRMRA